MKEQIEILAKLQEVEIETGKIKTFLGDAPERLNNLDTRLTEFEQMLEAEESNINEMKKTYRSYESDAQMSLSRIKKSQERLSSVKTNKEYQSILKEIEDLKEKNSQIEDKMLEYLDRIDEAESAVEAKRDDYLELSDQINHEKADIKQETGERKKRLAQLDTEWNKISEVVEPDLLQKFNIIKETISRVALVPVQDAICQGCHMNIPPQMYNELQRFDSLKFCPNCQRMIYWKKP